MGPKRRKAATRRSRSEANEGEAVDYPVLDGMDGADGVIGSGTAQQDDKLVFKISFGEKAISCERRGVSAKASLLFTHGAGGGLANPATRDFATGFAKIAPVVSFQGTMNLQSRVRTFHAVIEHQEGETFALGGRSLGARAAVVASKEHDTKTLILVSYPLVGGKKGDVRDQILFDLPEGIDVLFIVGSNDKMCSVEQLIDVTKKMKPRCWLTTVQGADHSMSIKQKAGVGAVGQRTGVIAAEWLRNRNEAKRFCAIEWNDESGEVISTAWMKQPQSTDEIEQDNPDAKPPAKKRRKN